MAPPQLAEFDRIPGYLEVMFAIRRLLGSPDPLTSIPALIERIRAFASNIEPPARGASEDARRAIELTRQVTGQHGMCYLIYEALRIHFPLLARNNAQSRV